MLVLYNVVPRIPRSNIGMTIYPITRDNILFVSTQNYIIRQDSKKFYITSEYASR